eukprot:4064109-Pyramimonas_sp.AAC.1
MRGMKPIRTPSGNAQLRARGSVGLSEIPRQSPQSREERPKAVLAPRAPASEPAVAVEGDWPPPSNAWIRKGKIREEASGA